MTPTVPEPDSPDSRASDNLPNLDQLALEALIRRVVDQAIKAYRQEVAREINLHEYKCSARQEVHDLKLKLNVTYKIAVFIAAAVGTVGGAVTNYLLRFV